MTAQIPPRGYLQDLARASVMQPSQPLIPSSKSEELLEMESILKSVYRIIFMANRYLKKDWEDEYLSIIEEHARAFLKNYGLELCRKVAYPIINLVHVPFTSDASLLDFYALCKAQKDRDEAEKKTQEKLEKCREWESRTKEEQAKIEGSREACIGKIHEILPKFNLKHQKGICNG